ncbi:MAG: VWA domain-containing protein [Prevotella sp.]|nr:VWA domain-containing protein [Prevotella sp.]MDY4852788.1 VWA domain-containing protein [Prevotella sp.]
MRFYVLVDTSGSMEGAKIGALNDAMSNIVAELKQISCSTNQSITLSVLSFGKETKWMYNQSVNVDDFTWNRLSAGGMTPLGKACIELERDLKSDTNKPDDNTFVILVSDGCPTDDFEEGIEVLLANHNFINSTRFAIAIGENADIPVLSRFVELDSHLYIQNRVDELLDTLQNIICNIRTTAPITYSKENEEDDEWA